MALERRIHAHPVSAHAAGLDRVVKSDTGDHAAPEALITYPVRDLQGDVVDPGGIDWADFNSVHERRVNLEHGPYIGTAEVSYKSVPRLNAEGAPDESLGLIALPFGTTSFYESLADVRNHSALPKYDARGTLIGRYTADECLAHAEQTAPLVADGTLSGVSLEFTPNGTEGAAYKSLGASPLLKHRDAYHFFRTRALGYAAACELPVNKFAGYVRASDETLAKAEKALRVCDDPRTLDFVRKSLTPLASLLERNPINRTTTPVRRDPVSKPNARQVKAGETGQYDETAPPPADAPIDTPVDQPPPDDSGVTATAAAAFNAAQGLLDLCAMVRDQVAKGEHVKGKKKLLAICDSLEKDAADCKAVGDMVTADVGGDSAEESESAEEPAAPDTDDDGAIVDKSFGGFRPRRFVKAAPYTLKHLKHAAKVSEPPAGMRLVDAKYLDDLEKILAEHAEQAGK